jgi:hypothetical protein
MSIAEDEARKMFHDRIRFKFHCAEQHLNNLKSFAEAKDAEGTRNFIIKHTELELNGRMKLNAYYST